MKKEKKMKHIIELEEGTKVEDVIKNFYYFNRNIRIIYEDRVYCKDFRKVIYENDIADKTVEKIIIKRDKIDIHIKEKPDKKKYPVSMFVIN